MKKLSKKTVTLAIVMAALLIASTALAAVYISRQWASPMVFRGRIEQPADSGARLVLVVNGEEVDDNADLTTHLSQFPLLDGLVTGSTDGVWTDETGKTALTGPSMSLQAREGGVNEIFCQVRINSTPLCDDLAAMAEAMTIGLTIHHVESGQEQYGWTVRTKAVDTGDGYAESQWISLGDIQTLDHEIRVDVSAWAEEYAPGTVGIELVFASGHSDNAVG